MKLKSIATKILLSVVPIVLLTTIIYVIMIGLSVSRRTRAEFHARMEESVRAARLNVRNELQLNADVARALANYAGICSPETIEKGELKEFLLKTVGSNKNTVGGGIWYEPNSLWADKRYFSSYTYIRDGSIQYTGAYEETLDYFSTEWYANGKNSKGEAVWSNIYYEPVAELVMMTTSLPFFDEQGDFMGVVTADMALTNIVKITEDAVVGKTGNAFVLEANGEYISFVDESRSAGMLITEDTDKELRALGNTILNSDDGSAEITWGGKKRRVYYTTIRQTQWILVVILDQAEIDQAAASETAVLAMVPVMGLCLVCICIYRVSHSLKRIADKVNYFADRAVSGDLSERIEVSENDEFGEMEKRLNIMMDNMEQMRGETSRMLKASEAASEAKTKFLSSVSHEMRTPMNAIIGMVQVADESPDERTVRDCLKRIGQASENLLELINHVLDMAKIEANKLELEESAFSVAQTFGLVRNMFELQTGERSQTLTMTIDDQVPGYIVSDKIRYSQVLINLISNAVKFTPNGGRIEVAAKIIRQEGAEWILETNVDDTGIGIAHDSEHKLFEPFEQADSSISQQYGGTGLGLSICKNLARLMGGDIVYRPGEDGGSSFIFRIKVKKAEVVPRRIADKMPEKLDYHDCVILLAEDIEVNRMVVSAMLKKTGVQIDYALNGAEACRMFAEQPGRYDLIFMDIQMPVMDGLTAARTIRDMECGKVVPIYAMSANAFREDIKNSTDAGMNGHISKPLSRGIILETLQREFTEE